MQHKSIVRRNVSFEAQTLNNSSEGSPFAKKKIGGFGMNKKPSTLSGTKYIVGQFSSDEQTDSFSDDNVDDIEDFSENMGEESIDRGTSASPRRSNTKSPDHHHRRGSRWMDLAPEFFNNSKNLSL